MHGRVCLVTGATNGVGLVTARELAARGATVVVVGRDSERTQRAVAAIKARTGNAALQGLVVDLSSQHSVRSLAQRVAARYPRLHVLVNNAGAIFWSRTVSTDGIEMTLALNHLGYFLLTSLLLPLLTISGASGNAARIVNVASEAHRRARIDFDDIQSQHRYHPRSAYARSKLMNILFTYELDRRLQAGQAKGQVTVNCLHPGVVDSGFYSHRRGILRLVYPLARPFFVPPERGAETQIWLATSPAVEGLSGRYFARKRERQSSRASYDTQAARRLWEVSERLVAASDAPTPSAPAA